jgi:hypothetical protein
VQVCLVFYCIMHTVHFRKINIHYVHYLLCLNLKTKIISCFLISVTRCSYYFALEPCNSFQREMFRSGSVMQWRSLASTYLNVVLPPNA